MSGASPGESSNELLLRAELHHPGGSLVTHTLHVTGRTICVACGELLAPGTAVRIVLSFPRLVDPFEVQARVVSTRADEGPGKPASVACDITLASPRAQKVLEALVALRAAAPSPPASGAATGTARGATDAAPAGGYRCLLVEDNGFIRDLFEYGLDKYGRIARAELSLDLASDAEQAWTMLSSSRYDLAIIDHYLPAQTGTELIARMRAEPKLARIPVVAISVGGPEVREASMAAGADLFLDKPIVLRDLFSTLDRLTLREAQR